MRSPAARGRVARVAAGTGARRRASRAVGSAPVVTARGWTDSGPRPEPRARRVPPTRGAGGAWVRQGQHPPLAISCTGCAPTAAKRVGIGGCWWRPTFAAAVACAIGAPLYSAAEWPTRELSMRAAASSPQVLLCWLWRASQPARKARSSERASALRYWIYAAYLGGTQRDWSAELRTGREH